MIGLAFRSAAVLAPVQPGIPPIIPPTTPSPRPRRPQRPTLPPTRRTPRPADRVRLPSRDLDTHGEIAPIDVWWGLEDLWLRLHQDGRLRSGEADTLVLPCFRHRAAGNELGQAVFEVERYDWRLGLLRGSFVRTLHYDGDDLVCQLTPPSVMARWPDGQTLIHLRAALLLRVRSQA